MAAFELSHRLIPRGATGVDAMNQWIRRTSPQTWQRATPAAASISRKLVQPFVLQ
jgi:hypothetical protein